MNRSNSKIVRSAIRQHILESVYNLFDGEQFPTYQEAAEYLMSEFNRVANFPANIQRHPSNQNRFMDYMRGVPFHFHIYYCDISTFLSTLDLNGGGHYSDETSEKFYFYLIYSELLKAVSK